MTQELLYVYIPSNWTPVLAVQRQCLVRRCKEYQIFRRQYLLRPVTAKTMHKSQEDTQPA